MGGEVIQGSSSVAPEGVFCQRPDIYRRRLPDMPDQFSVKIETVDEVKKINPSYTLARSVKIWTC